jgi:endonuclease YncB( thermonuclease family)
MDAPIRRAWRPFVLRILLLAVLTCLLAAAVASPPASAADRDCADFPNRAAAQDWLNAYPADPDGLDGDHDGLACESLPCPCASGAPAATTPPAAPPPPPPSAAPQPARVLEAQARVTSVIDGDTLKVRFANGVATRVRLIGIDTPETKKPGTPVECGGRAATARMKKLALRSGRGRSVTVRSDPTQALTDEFGRLLAYVSAGGDDFGRVMVASGWARTHVYGDTDFQRVRSYRKAARAARAARRGVHGRCASDFHRAAARALAGRT